MSQDVISKPEIIKLDYVAMSGQSNRFKKKWIREKARKLDRDSRSRYVGMQFSFSK